ncbi:hypothetical protein GCK72_020274 [Caenorhabditis remanei]|uniref:Uncharacterized protein n=1 Tax=Caenorhabditis remanei TaxID=31234 RepID=A0A6A5GEP7_CAERE|nr:hypothetical protein GCK72_020274 [Caenorhabditis remanei]KAF1753717.1 hypothetical protein GCK72_020274 [Caenorhabditis remanei]
MPDPKDTTKSIKLLRFWKEGLGVVKKINILSFILFPLVYTGYALLVKFEFDFRMAQSDSMINKTHTEFISDTMEAATEEVNREYYLAEFIMLQVCFLFNSLAIYLNDIFLLITLEHSVLEKMGDQLF